MYKAFYGLSDNPFSIAPNPHYLFLSDRHREALTHLTYGLGETGGFVLLTGEVGTGKTTVSRTLLNQLPEHTDTAFILNPSLTELELLATLCDELGIQYAESPTLKQLTDLISQYLLKNHENGRNTVMIIDEAQHLRAEVLEQLRLLTNLETDTKKLLQVILIGQPELQQLLKRQELRQLAQRITARYHLLPLNEEEVGLYVQHRLQVAGRYEPLFNSGAIKALHKQTGGIPRLINLLCERALMAGYGQSKLPIDRKIIQSAASEVLGLDAPQQRWFWPAASGCGFAVSFAVGLLLFSPESVPVRIQAAQPSSQVQQPIQPLKNIAVQGAATSLDREKRYTMDPQPFSQGQQPINVSPKALIASQRSEEVPLAAASLNQYQQASIPMQQQAIAQEELSHGVARAQAADPNIREATMSVVQQHPQPYTNKQSALANAIAQSRDIELAYAALFGVWQKTPIHGLTACQAAKEQGLSCYQQQGNWLSMSQLNYPAVVYLVDDSLHSFYGTVVRIEGSQMLLQLAEQQLWVSREWFTEHFSGTYEIFWQRPEGLPQEISRSSSSGQIQWLENSLARLDNKSPRLVNRLDAQLEQRLKAFQRTQGLKPDGIAGRNTLIKLNLFLSLDGPRLQQSERL
ncbi:ExeA family protein [Shewanella gelidii]|uniref:AAA+ ATPase domain-containing protein n=1 Tax=Shewanella gelidii TaxID=1642821 RepID=A0A917JKM3_9GAMM|nr:ExeA family protein [Shewanella gelidii]MCL1096711.1 AAA family ATPase [Shewanella gelidii]GGI69673.1 hypothetical protein GCM10009332_03450 [Shewanella gelidii]